MNSFVVCRDLFAACMTGATFFATYAVAGAPTREAQRFGMRGFKRERALARGGAFAGVEPLLRWTAFRLSGLLSDGLRASLDRQLRVAGDFLGLTAEEYAAATVLGIAAGALLGAVVGLALGSAALLVILCTPLGAATPYLLVSGEGQQRLRQIRHGLPHAIDLMTLSMSAGLDFPAAVRQVVDKATAPEDPLTEELRHLLSGLQLGRTRKQALLELADRAPADSVVELVSALVQAEERGNPIAQVLSIQAGCLRRHRTARAEQAAARAGVAMAGPLFLLFAGIMILLVAPMILKLQRGF